MDSTAQAESDPRWRELTVAFRAELGERVGAINRMLLELERHDQRAAAPTDQLRAVMREAHSLKGAARAAAHRPVERLAHALESALERAIRNGTDLGAAWFGVVYRAVDALGSAVDATERDMAILESEHRLGSLLPAKAQPPAGPERRPPAVLADATPVNGHAPPPQGSVRIAIAKLDTLLAQSGELSVVSVRIEQRLNELAELGRSLGADLRRKRGAPDALLVRQQVDELAARLRQDTVQLAQVSHAISDDVLSARLVPMATLFVRLERVVRDLTRESGKEALLELEGGQTELDRRIVEQLADPLLHLLRNAVDHGIESPDERHARGKSRSGVIRVSARPRGGTVVIEVEDDGAGLDPRVLRQRALQQGLLAESQAQLLDDAAAIELIFRPGFSTRARVTETSGRGVGMDVVRTNVEALSGDIQVRSVPGQGTGFTLTLPLTLATTRTILAAERGRLFAVPSSAVERLARVQTQTLLPVEGRRTVAVEHQPVPVIELAHLLELPPGAVADSAARDWRPYLVLRQADRRVAILTDELVGEQEVVVKPLGWPLSRVRNVSGAAVLGTGQIAVILNPADLLKTALRLVGEPPRPEATRVDGTEGEGRPRRARLLVVDDSVITRTMERSILEAAGYEVEAVADGIEALGVLRGDAVDLVVADVEMPRMDGFALTAAIRGDDQLRHIPVVLVTSLGAREHRERGVAVGADAYIVKSAFDQGQLLQTIGRLL